MSYLSFTIKTDKEDTNPIKLVVRDHESLGIALNYIERIHGKDKLKNILKSKRLLKIRFEGGSPWVHDINTKYPVDYACIDTWLNSLLHMEDAGLWAAMMYYLSIGLTATSAYNMALQASIMRCTPREYATRYVNMCFPKNNVLREIISLDALTNLLVNKGYLIQLDYGYIMLNENNTDKLRHEINKTEKTELSELDMLDATELDKEHSAFLSRKRG